MHAALRANFVYTPARIVATLTLAFAAALAAPPRTAHAQPPAVQPAAPVADAAAAPSDAPTDPPDENIVIPERLIDRQPFDRVTLNEANASAVLDVVLLDLPERRVPDPLPQEGRLEVRQVTQPSVAYTVDWTAVSKIELFEQVLLAEAERLTAAGEFVEAFDYFAFLQTNYPNLPGLKAALEDYLWRDASSAFAAGDGDSAWPSLVALYERNPAYPRLVNAVQAVSDALIAQRLKVGDYSAARAVLELLEGQFPDLELANIAQWRERFEAEAEKNIAAARSATASGDFDAARAAAMIAGDILPDADEPRRLLQEIQSAALEVRIGVTQFGAVRDGRSLAWAAARVAPLVDPRLVVVADFGAEGGMYATHFGQLETSSAGLETTLSLSPAALRQGITPDAAALALAERASAHGSSQDADFAAALAGLKLVNGNELLIGWRRPSLHPEAFLQLPLRQLTTAERAPGLWFEPRRATGIANEVRYDRTGPRESSTGRAQTVAERIFESDEAALGALAQGDVDAIDRVPPWLLEQARDTRDVVVTPYRLPTVHVLIPNFDNPLVALREFRRALCYGSDRASIVRDILLAGDPSPGFVALSGPFPAGVSLNDPAGYGYNGDILPRPYEPRLAALLANVARTTLTKRDAAARKERGEPDAPADPTLEPQVPPPTPLVLAHPADPLARLACQSLKLQWDRVGIPVKLIELPANDPDAAVPYDLLYAELAVWEPLTDARLLLGANGAAGRSSALMTAALNALAQSENWNDARGRLREIHRIAHYDLPLIPLWQTVNHFAHRKWLTGVGEQPLALYQNVDEWRKEYDLP